MTHSDLVRRASGRPDCVLLLANYYDAWQLSLDGNLLEHARAAHRAEAAKWAALIEDRLEWTPLNPYSGEVSAMAVMLSGTRIWPPGMGSVIRGE